MSSDKPGCTQNEVTITQADLPLSCPLKSERVWDGHPRVYLTLGNNKSITCPYCSTIYRISNEK